MPVSISTVLVGQISPLGRRGVASGIFKQPVYRDVEVIRSGLAGDAQGDRKHHGGLEKALHHYAFEHYAAWKSESPALAEHLVAPGAFGENISTVGATEADICIGDIYRLGTATVEVSQARQPCWRLNERFGATDMARRVQNSGRTGWYYRVLAEGSVRPGDSFTLLERPAKNWSLERILRVLYHTTLDGEALAELAELEQLSASWRTLVRRRLERCTVEDWSQRLESPDDSVL